MKKEEILKRITEEREDGKGWLSIELDLEALAEVLAEISGECCPKCGCKHFNDLDGVAECKECNEIINK